MKNGFLSMIITKEKPDYLYRKGVGMMVVNQKKRIFVGKRIRNRSDLWQMPQGGLNVGEEEKIAAFRELKEETGIVNAKIIKESQDYYYYNLPYALQKKFWRGKYLGQRQKWFLLKFYGDLYEDVNLQNAMPEFSRFKWVDVDTLLNSVVSFKKKMYEQIVNEFEEFLK